VLHLWYQFRNEGPDTLNTLVLVLVLGCLVNFAVIYLMSGLFSRLFHKQLLRQGEA
jgi:hypothetical protein